MSRPPTLRASFDSNELTVDLFAGGGGASTGIEAALQRPIDIAINHDPDAIRMHKANHPETKHYLEDIWEVDPKEACGGRPVGLLWLSPSCTNFSRAKGGKPLDNQLRSLAWVGIRWAEEVRPRVIALENVEEWKMWGDLDTNGFPVPGQVGATFRAWCGRLNDLGYQLEYKSLVAADYGTPTTRKRLFLIARCDKAPIVWPEATHGKGRANSWRPAAEIIDWTLPCPSIFDRKKPLKEATMRRIAAGLKRYVLDAAEPFIIPVTHAGDSRVHGLDEPLRTVTGAHRGELALVGPTLIQTGWGERPGQAPRVPGLEKPLGTLMAQGIKHALVAPVVLKHYGGVVGHDVRKTLGTVTARDHHSLAAAWLTKFYGTSIGSSLADPMPTVLSGGGRGGSHIAEVRAFLIKYYSAGGRGDAGQDLRAPLHTVPTHDRFGLVMVHGALYQIIDITMRMLQPHELFLAQGFPNSYRIDEDADGRPFTKSVKTKLVGNSVCPPVAQKLIEANVRVAA